MASRRSLPSAMRFSMAFWGWACFQFSFAASWWRFLTRSMAVDGGHGAIDGVAGDVHVAGDLVDGPAVFHADEDGLALGGGAAMEDAGAGALAVEFVPVGFWDFVAVEQAAGEVGDDEVPAGVVGAGEAGDAVAGVTGEGW